MTEPRSVVVDSAAVGARLDRFLSDQLPALSRSRLQQLVIDGLVQVNGLPARPATSLRSGDVVSVTVPDEVDDAAPLPAPDMALTVLHADAAILVVDKPAGVVVHPAAGHSHDTLVNALLARYPDLAAAFGDERPGIVHRLDRDTSGVMVVARTPGAAESLKAQFKARTVGKTYLALVKGLVTPPAGVIDAPIGRDPRQRKRMAAIVGGRAAQTTYHVLATVDGYSWVEALPQTGRTHQIRVHFTSVGHPIAGDSVYGKRDRHIGRMALHAWSLAFEHPTSGDRVTFRAPLPEDLRGAIEGLGIRWDARAEVPRG